MKLVSNTVLQSMWHVRSSNYMYPWLLPYETVMDSTFENVLSYKKKKDYSCRAQNRLRHINLTFFVSKFLFMHSKKRSS